MLGLPNSESLQRNVLEELEKILFYKPSHISLYILTTKESYIHQKSLPKDDWIAEEYLKVSNFLIERGFNHYEVSNFSLPGKESKHNLRYWSLDSVAALGPSGTGFLKGNKGGFRYKWNVHDSRVKEEVLSKREFELEKIYLSLRTFRGLNVSDLFGKDNDHALYSLIDEWRLKGYLSSLENERVSLSPKGFLLLDSIMDDLFREKIV
jgi:oxygen-independent coproporphyrinogen-3 oxidase